MVDRSSPDIVERLEAPWHDALGILMQPRQIELEAAAEIRRLRASLQPATPTAGEEIARLIDVLRADEGDSVTILCDNPDFNGQPNCAIECCGDWTGWLHKRFAADTLLDALSMAMVERNLPSPRKVIATSNGHHWIERFNLVCCRDCGFVRRADDQNKPCQGVVGVGIRRDLLSAAGGDAVAGAAKAVAQRYLDCITDDMPPEVKMPTVTELGNALLAALRSPDVAGDVQAARSSEQAPALSSTDRQNMVASDPSPEKIDPKPEPLL